MTASNRVCDTGGISADTNSWEFIEVQGDSGWWAVPTLRLHRIVFVMLGFHFNRHEQLGIYRSAGRFRLVGSAHPTLL